MYGIYFLSFAKSEPLNQETTTFTLYLVYVMFLRYSLEMVKTGHCKQDVARISDNKPKLAVTSYIWKKSRIQQMSYVRKCSSYRNKSWM